jgi:hypothetical protein
VYVYVCLYVLMYIHGHYFCPLIKDSLVSVMVFQVKETSGCKGRALFRYSSLHVQAESPGENVVVLRFLILNNDEARH